MSATKINTQEVKTVHSGAYWLDWGRKDTCTGIIKHFSYRFVVTMKGEYLRLSRTLAVKEVSHNSAVSVAGEEAFTGNTDTEETKSTEEENSRVTFERVQPVFIFPLQVISVEYFVTLRRAR